MKDLEQFIKEAKEKGNVVSEGRNPYSGIKVSDDIFISDIREILLDIEEYFQEGADNIDASEMKNGDKVIAQYKKMISVVQKAVKESDKLQKLF